MKKLLLCLTGVSLLLSSCVALEAYPPSITLERDCLDPEHDFDTKHAWEYAPKTVSAIDGWRFTLDPDDVGLDNGFASVGFDVSDWDESAPGISWEEQGIEYDGVGWYSAEFAPKEFWDTFYLGIGNVDDDATIWINGVETEWRLVENSTAQVVELPVEPLTVTIRVVDNGGFGGIKSPVLVGRTPFDVLTEADYASWLAANHPDWPLPGWMRNAYYAWTFTGQFTANSGDAVSNHEALYTSDIAVAPWADAPTIALLYKDQATGMLTQPDATFSLVGGVSPIPKANWVMNGLTVDTTLVTDYENPKVNWQLVITNPTDVAIQTNLIALTQPYGVHRELSGIHGIAFDRDQRIWVNGNQPFAAFSRPADFVQTGQIADVISNLQTDQLAGLDKLPCANAYDGAAAATFAIELPPGGTYALNIAFAPSPDLPLPDATAGSVLGNSEFLYNRDIGEPSFVIPDEFVTNAYRASKGYLLVAEDRDGIRPGPNEHDAIWIRDLAYIGEALFANDDDLIKRYLDVPFQFQTEDGMIPPVLEGDGQGGLQPRAGMIEWDSQGQAIFLIAETHRYQPDIARLEQYYDNVYRAADFIRQKRTETVNNPPETRGLLPPSESAEDLGPDHYHHYWDDFWSVAGLEDAAFIATELGHTEDAEWMLAEAEELRQAIHASVEAVMGPEPAYVPGAPENIESSAMARGTGPAMFPAKTWEWDDPLMARAFDEYHQRWINPTGGGYIHIFGQFWPYGGLGLARNYLRLGRQDVVHQILGWTLTNQTLPGAFVWAEQVSPQTGAISGGDMPHAWAMANYIMLIREMLVIRDGDTLELFAGVPPSWLEAGKEIQLNGLTTVHGDITAQMTSTLQIIEESWQGELNVSVGGATPPDGFRWRLQQIPTGVVSDQDVVIDGEWLYIPSDGAEFTLIYE